MRTYLTGLALLGFIAGCGSSNGGMTGGMDAAGGGGGGGSGGVTYQDVKPLFVQKCTPCHAQGGVGAAFHTLADSYDTANKPAEAGGACPGKKMGECTIVMVKMGFMPFGKNCSGDPTRDSANPACLTAAEQKLLEDWVAGGLREK